MSLAVIKDADFDLAVVDGVTVAVMYTPSSRPYQQVHLSLPTLNNLLIAILHLIGSNNQFTTAPVHAPSGTPNN